MRNLPTLVKFSQRQDEDPPDPIEIADARDHFTAADLADLRWLVTRLPNRERLAVTLRFWYGASEAELGEALGGVTTRTVRNTLVRAYAQLRSAYLGAQTAAPHADDHADDHADAYTPHNEVSDRALHRDEEDIR